MASFPQRSNPTVDRISDLPDSILCHILSFLPTKQAFTTSILSKRWKPIWLSVLALDFDDETFKDFDSFHKFVHSTMFKLRDKKTPIHSFSLKLRKPSYFNQKQLNRIFKFVMERGGVNLNFDMFARRFIKLPHSILSIKTLQVLKLTFLSIRDFDQMDFPVLKTLHLHTVYFKSQEYCVKFLFGCPVLQDLHLQNILHRLRGSFVPMENMNALPNLVKVRIFYDKEFTLKTLFCNAKVLHIEKMSISRNWLVEVLPYFPKLQHFIIQDCARADDCWKNPQTAPECISSQLKTCCIRGYEGATYEFEFVKYIMQHSNVLETMTVKSTTRFLKNQMFVKLSSCKRGSTTCKLLFH